MKKSKIIKKGMMRIIKAKKLSFFCAMGLNSKGKPCDLHTFERPMRTAEPTIGINPDPTAYHSFLYISS